MHLGLDLANHAPSPASRPMLGGLVHSAGEILIAASKNT